MRLDPVQSGFIDKCRKATNALEIQDMRHILIKKGFSQDEAEMFLGAMISFIQRSYN